VSWLIFKLGTFQKERISIVTIYTTAIRCCEQGVIDFYSKNCVITPVVVVEPVHCCAFLKKEWLVNKKFERMWK